jgi:GT2 family glycosyltransferase
MPQIEAVVVNHNTSAYAELMLRSLFARHDAPLDLAITVYDNASTDDMSRLAAFAASRGVPILPSGFTTQSRNNSHGEVLRRFVLEHPDCAYYLFLDADVCFVEEETIPTMVAELEAAPDAFGIGARMSWDGVVEMPAEVIAGNPDLYAARLHPCCALVRNTPVFQAVAREVGFSCVRYLWGERDEYFDTFRLMTSVMRTHGLRHARSACMVLHFFCVSYEWDDEALRASKAARRDALLAGLRAGG